LTVEYDHVFSNRLSVFRLPLTYQWSLTKHLFRGHPTKCNHVTLTIVEIK